MHKKKRQAAPFDAVCRYIRTNRLAAVVAKFALVHAKSPPLSELWVEWRVLCVVFLFIMVAKIENLY